jgi:hypothetical protein
MLIPLAVLVTFAWNASAQTVAIHGWIDAYYAWNNQHPEPRRNFFSGVGTTAHRSDQLSLNIIALDLTHDPKPFGFHVTLVGGDSSNVVHAGEPHGQRRLIRNVYQASITYIAPIGKGVALEAGVYPSHIGFEGFFTKDDWNYTRGWLAELSLYYQTGIKASYAWNDRWSGQLHVIRGWQLIEDNNSSPAVGAQVAYSGHRLSASLNTFIGAELPHDKKHHRTLGDIVVTSKVTPKMSVGTSIDRGRQDLPGGAAANWFGVAAYGRYAFDDRHSLAVRTERFRDRDAGISGIAQTLTEITITYQLCLRPHLTLKIEGRRDDSTAFVFNHSRMQTLGIASAVASF